MKSTDLPENLLQRFDVKRELGRGAMGRVLLAKDRKLQRSVAVKLLLDHGSEQEAWLRFIEEARVLSELRHESIVALLDFSDEGSQPFIVFEYVDGPTISQEITKNGARTLEELQEEFRVLCMAMAYAHGQGILHRDLKGENVFLSEIGPKIGDFGLALRSDRSQALTRTGLLMGTPAYMAPELIHGAKASASSDVYAAGCLFYLMATGQVPSGQVRPTRNIGSFPWKSLLIPRQMAHVV